LLNSKIYPKKRRGISTVVGTLIFLVLMISGFSMLTLALDTQIDLVDTQRLVSDSEIKKNQEKFAIAASTDVASLLQIHVNNLGKNPVEIASFWLINKTDSNQPAKQYLINYDNTFISSGFGSDIVASDGLYMTPDDYDIKVVSYLGSIEKTTLTVDGSGGNTNNLRAELFTIPPDVIIGQNVTAAMLVTNTGKIPLDNVTPDTPTITPASAIILPLPSDPAPVNLSPAESILFTWQYQLTGNNQDVVSFSSKATAIDVNNNPVQSNVAMDKLILRDLQNSLLNVLSKELISRPEIFITKPAPFGDSSDKGVWGINVVNPTNLPMDITKITVSLISPRGQSNDVMFDAGGGDYCDPETISPSINSWSCPSANQLMWKNMASPQTVLPLSVYSFMAKVMPGKLAAGNVDLESVVVHVSVFTNVGEFGKAGYGSSMRNTGDSLVNVYLSDVPGSTSSTDIRASRTDIISNTEETFNVVMADFDTGSNYIKSNSQLIINLPKGWSIPIIDSSTGFNTPIINTFGDTHQIIATTSVDIIGNDDARTIQFRSTAPTVTNTQMYVVYVLAEGETGNNFSIAPLSEIILQVCPTSGCS